LALDDERSLAASVPEPLRKLESEVEALVARGAASIPPYPAVALRVQKAMNQPDFGLDEVAHLVGADAALAADVLRCANSSMYRRGSAVTSLTQAITRIGATQVMRLLLASGLAAHANVAGPLAKLRRMIWIEGLASAAICQELARQRGLRHEEAFALGLLHDFGRVVACGTLEALLAKHPLAGAWPEDAWFGVVDRLHVPVGLAMAARWQLGSIVTEVIGGHHLGPAARCEDPGLLDVVRVSDQVVFLLSSLPGLGNDDLEAIPSLTKFVEREVVARVLRKVPEFVEAFELAATPNGAGSPIAQPATTLSSGERPVRFGLTVNLARRTRQFTAVAIAPNGIAATGSEPLPENRLQEATLHAPQGPLRIWTLTRLARQDHGGYHVELHPYALSGVERGLWDQLVAGDTRAT
jgi:HD-like signal output (HDOD) protein